MSFITWKLAIKIPIATIYGKVFRTNAISMARARDLVKNKLERLDRRYLVMTRG